MSTGQPALVGMLEDVPAIIRSLGIPIAASFSLADRSGRCMPCMVYPALQVAGVILESGIAIITERFFMRVQPAELGMSKTALVDELQRHFDYAANYKVFRVARWYCTPDTTSWSMHATRNCSMPRPRSHAPHLRPGGHNDIFYRNRQAYMQQVETFLAALAGIPDHC